MTLARLISAAAFAALVSAPVYALDVKKEASVPASPKAAWAALGDFCGIADWHPAVTKCELSMQDKAIYRTLTLKGDAILVEKLLSWNAAHHRYSYSIISGPLPVDNYRSTISVEKGKKGTVIRWVGKFDAKGAPDDKAVEVIAGVYQGGLDSLVKKLTK